MDVQLTIRNYRCFPESRPARIDIRSGFTSFVGTNNSGKSTLLKFFYEFRDLFRRLSDPNVLNQCVKGGTSAFGPAPSLKDLVDLFNDRNTRNLDIELAFPTAAPGPFPVPKCVVTVFRPQNQFTLKMIVDGRTIAHDNSNSVAGTMLQYGQRVERAELEPLISTAKRLSNTLYIGPFRNAINVGANDDYFDIKVGQRFVQDWKGYKMGSSKAQNKAAYQLTQDIADIFEFDDLEINPAPGDDTLQVFINSKSYKLNDVGSGLTQFVLVLANAAIKKPDFILIDEPESNLHPSLQLDFLTTLASYATEGILFATHNIGLARASAERVYSVRKISNGESEVAVFESTPRLAEFVGELSFFGYRELGFDKILLVEGPNDVKTAQQFLRSMRKDHRIVLLHLGGSSLIHSGSEVELQEIKRISDNVYALIDSERATAGAPLSKERQDFIRNCEAAKIECHVLEWRAIENYLSDAAINAVKGPNYQAIGPYDSLASANPAWAKAEDWKIARQMTMADLAGTDLGMFLESL